MLEIILNYYKIENSDGFNESYLSTYYNVHVKQNIQHSNFFKYSN